MSYKQKAQVISVQANKKVFKGINNDPWDDSDSKSFLGFIKSSNTQQALPINVQQHSSVDKQEGGISSNE